MSARDALGRQFDAAAETETMPYVGMSRSTMAGGEHHSALLSPRHQTTGYALPGRTFLEHLRQETGGAPFVGNN